MTFIIRKAGTGDAVALGYIQVTSWRSAFRNIASGNFLDYMVSPEGQAEDWKLILADPDQVVLIAECGNTPVGYAWAHRDEDETIEWDSELISLHLLPEYKRQGIGRSLFSAVVTILKDQGCNSVFLWVLEDNHPARKFYEALGGELSAKQPIELSDSKLTEVAYGWKDISRLEYLE